MVDASEDSEWSWQHAASGGREYIEGWSFDYTTIGFLDVVKWFAILVLLTTIVEFIRDYVIGGRSFLEDLKDMMNEAKEMTDKRLKPSTNAEKKAKDNRKERREKRERGVPAKRKHVVTRSSE